jgi:multiple sugar transport system substrate-binding protein
MAAPFTAWLNWFLIICYENKEIYEVNRMRKLLWTITLLVLGLSVGCGSKSEKIIVKYENWESLPSQIALHQAVVDAFNAGQEEIYVKLVPVQGGPDKIKVEIAGGLAPDVFYWGDNMLPPLAEKGAVFDISGFIKESKLDLTQYYRPLLESLSYGKAVYGLPIYFGTTALVYNKNLFDAASLSYPHAGWTWDDFRVTARKLTKHEKGKASQFGALLPSPLDVVYSFGGSLFDTEGKNCLANSKETISALKFLQALQNTDKSLPSRSQLEGEDKYKSALQMFMTGRVAMLLAPSFLLSPLSDIKSFSWDVAPLPLNSDRKRITTFSTGTLHISSQSKVKRAAFKFMKFACGPEGTTILGKGRNCIPPIPEVADKTFKMPPPEHIGIYADALHTARPVPKIAWFNEYITSVYKPEMDLFLLGKQSAKQTADNLKREGMHFIEKR